MNTVAKKKINNTNQASILKKKFDRSLQYKKIVKKLIPICIGSFLIAIFFLPTIFTNAKKKLLMGNNASAIFNKMKDTENFSFQGIDELEQPFYLRAKKYKVVENNQNKLFFEKPKAEINLKEGKWVTLVAKQGIFDIKNKTLELVNDVFVLHSDGQQISTNNAIIDLNKGKFYGKRELSGRSDTITFSSEGFEVEKDDGNFSLLGKSKIKIEIK